MSNEVKAGDLAVTIRNTSYWCGDAVPASTVFKVLGRKDQDGDVAVRRADNPSTFRLDGHIKVDHLRPIDLDVTEVMIASDNAPTCRTWYVRSSTGKVREVSFTYIPQLEAYLAALPKLAKVNVAYANWGNAELHAIAERFTRQANTGATQDLSTAQTPAQAAFQAGETVVLVRDAHSWGRRWFTAGSRFTVANGSPDRDGDIAVRPAGEDGEVPLAFSMRHFVRAAKAGEQVVTVRATRGIAYDNLDAGTVLTVRQPNPDQDGHLYVEGRTGARFWVAAVDTVPLINTPVVTATQQTPAQTFSVGDRVETTQPTKSWHGRNYGAGAVFTVRDTVIDGDGDLKVVTDGGRLEFIKAASLRVIADTTSEQPKPYVFRAGDKVVLTQTVRNTPAGTVFTVKRGGVDEDGDVRLEDGRGRTRFIKPELLKAYDVQAQTFKSGDTVRVKADTTSYRGDPITAGTIGKLLSGNIDGDGDMAVVIDGSMFHIKAAVLEVVGAQAEAQSAPDRPLVPGDIAATTEDVMPYICDTTISEGTEVTVLEAADEDGDVKIEGVDEDGDEIIDWVPAGALRFVRSGAVETPTAPEPAPQQFTEGDLVATTRHTRSFTGIPFAPGTVFTVHLNGIDINGDVRVIDKDRNRHYIKAVDLAPLAPEQVERIKGIQAAIAVLQGELGRVVQ